ncbi:MAG TPA: phosphoheptose isomerase [Gammaproteobacteria bacterium]|jgi:D-sedoheptulose 7-phosphate isomerase|nr:phosphoheptose isomerase [Gammaproteobacteria bacterium]
MNEQHTTHLAENHFQSSAAVFASASKLLPPAIAAATQLCCDALLNGKKILTCGNGGSSGDAMHLSSELVNRYKMERPGLPAIALTTDNFILTSIANDYDYERVFARQVQALGQEGDILFAISTSGQSANIVRAVQTAIERDMTVIALSGRDGGQFPDQLRAGVDVEVRAPSDVTARIQEVHLVCIHAICDAIDETLFGGGG